MLPGGIMARVVGFVSGYASYVDCLVLYAPSVNPTKLQEAAFNAGADHYLTFGCIKNLGHTPPYAFIQTWKLAGKMDTVPLGWF